tara:strand:- start:3790 stop:4344 length:555 start_codon:yes stop_codon:yes gene_type:complete
MKKLILTESEKKAIISQREKAIMENFTKTFNSIKRIDENEVNELDLGSYANAMDKTDSFPMKKFNSSDKDNPRDQGNREGRVNDLANERFKSEFMKKYPIDGVSINTGMGMLPFKGIKFEANNTMYSLMFEYPTEMGGSLVFIHIDSSSPEGFYIDKKGLTLADDESKQLVKQMLRYNSQLRNN